MKPIKTQIFSGYYKGNGEDIGDLPYFKVDNSIYSVWELSDQERQDIANGSNLLVGQLGEPIHPISISLTNLVEDE